MSKISDLVALAKTDETKQYKEIDLGVIPNYQAQQINSDTGVFVRGAKKILSTDGIRHAFSTHGNAVLEAERGQVGIIDTDFDKLPLIFNTPDFIIKGATHRGKESIVFVKTINNNTYHVVMARVKDNLVLKTIFKKS